MINFYTNLYIIQTGLKIGLKDKLVINHLQFYTYIYVKKKFF